MKLGKSRCQCAACGRYFSSTSAFDKHRAWADKDGRRFKGRSRPRKFDYRVCLDPHEVGLMLRKDVFSWPGLPEGIGRGAVAA